MTGFINWFKVVRALNNLNDRVTTGENRMATFQEDVDKLTADLAAQTALISQIGALVAVDTQNIADLKAEVAALQGQTNPNLAGLEAGIATLEANNATLGGLVPPPAPPVTP